jgi:quinol monooxygenase YgiN
MVSPFLRCKEHRYLDENYASAAAAAASAAAAAAAAAVAALKRMLHEL